MPMLNVGFMTVDPMLADQFTVQRRLNVVGTNGRVSANADQLFEGLYGTITQQDPATLLKTEDGQSVPRRIFVASPFQFIAAAPDYQPDEITWNLTVYTVTEVFPYSRYGEGFYECIAEFRGPIPPQQ